MKTLKTGIVLFFILNCFELFSQQSDSGSIHLSLPNINWSLDLNIPDFKFEKRELSPDGKQKMISASNEKTGMVISVYLEPAASNGDKMN